MSHLTYRKIWFMLVGLLVFGILFPLAGSRAQGNATIVTIAIPEYMGDTLTPDIFQEFEAANPNIKILIVRQGRDSFVTPPSFKMDEFFKSAEQFVKTADVLLVSGYTLYPEAAYAGYFLDLAPLVSGDSSLNPDDFYPVAWNAFRWDNRMWALPVSANVSFMTYDAEAFDKAGIAYPSEQWTTEDLARATRALAVKDPDGKVTLPGFFMFNPSLLVASLAGESFYDNSSVPNSPKFAKPAFESVLATLVALQDEGVINAEFSSDFETVPMRIDGPYVLLSRPGADGAKVRKGALLPGGKAGVDVNGFAISAGTQHPTEAFTVLKFLTSNIRVANGVFGVSPARKSLVGVQDPTGRMFRPNFTPEVKELIEKALTNGLSVGDLRFSEYVNSVLERMKKDKLEAKAALEAVEQTALENWKAAAERAGRNTTNSLAVSTPVPTPILATSEVSIKFRLIANVSPLPNREAWDKAIQEFVDKDSQVGQVVFETGFGMGFDELTEKYDCFIPPPNFSGVMDTKKLLDLDPLMSADPTFDKNDLVTGILQQMQRDGKTYGYPIAIQPQVLTYNVEVFAKNNVPEPANGWTISTFNDTLKALKVDPSAPAPLAPQTFGGATFYILIAAYGGLPLDFRTDPPAIKFTDPATVDAIRQVLDLARKGYIRYSELAGFGGSGGFGPEIPILGDVLESISYRQRFMNPDRTDPYKLVNYPRGSQFAAISYDIATAYISAAAQNPEACYRWISFIASRLDLVTAMPARRSLINAPTLEALHGADLVALYKDLEALIQTPDTIVIPSPMARFSFSDYVLQYVLNRTFDRYVLKDADLVVELTEAEKIAKGIQECFAAIPTPDLALRTDPGAFNKYRDCALKVDPTLKALFPDPQQ